MILCLDVGNTQVYGGVFDQERLKTQFRRTSQLNSSSDELGVFFRAVFIENNIALYAVHSIFGCEVGA